MMDTIIWLCLAPFIAAAIVMLLASPFLLFGAICNGLTSKDPAVRHNAEIGDRIQKQYYSLTKQP